MTLVKRIYRAVPWILRRLKKDLQFRIDARHIDRGHPRVYYGHPGDDIGGPLAKIQRLGKFFPNCERRFNLVYSVNSILPSYEDCLRAKRAGIKLVYNADGVGWYYRELYGEGWEERWKELLELMRRTYSLADYIFFQSHFAKLSAETFLGSPPSDYEILYNAVDTQHFTPKPRKIYSGPLTLLAAGWHWILHRLEVPVKALKLVLQERQDVQLIIAGRISERVDKGIRELVGSLGLEDHVTFRPPYTQTEAPSVYHQADILLHAKYNDPCPSVVIEAMACGLPVVYSDSGGTPELVGPEAGIGIHSGFSWDEILAPSPQGFAQAILQLAEERERASRSLAARERAVQMFDIRPWIERHRCILNELLGIDD